ncbi:Hypothetical predicted protein, partial [Olea europaea subsp. europaea]
DQEDPEANDHIPPPAELALAPNLQVMRQLFTGLTETNRTLQYIEQMIRASQAREQARDDEKHARNANMQGIE